MNNCTKDRGVFKLLMCLGVGMMSLFPKTAFAVEETFPTLQLGTHVYTNVTVTTKAKTYIFIHHSAGMENIKVADLPEDIRIQLGYVPEVTKAQKASNWAKEKIGDVHIGQVNAAELKDPKIWREQSAVVIEKARSLDRRLCGAILGGLLLLYLFKCFCFMLICKKAGTDPGILIWVPFFQIFPLLRAARMSAWWVLAFILVVPGFIGGITWCFKIAEARGKSAFVGLLLLLPVTNFFAFLYLAFSDGVPEPQAPKEDNRTSHLMTLETT